MWVLVVISLLALVAVVATALGDGWGPALLGFGFGGWAALILWSGLGEPFPLFGIIYGAAALAEFLAAYEFWRWHDHPEARTDSAGHSSPEGRVPAAAITEAVGGAHRRWWFRRGARPVPVDRRCHARVHRDRLGVPGGAPATSVLRQGNPSAAPYRLSPDSPVWTARTT